MTGCCMILLLLGQQAVSEHLTLGNPTNATAPSDTNFRNALFVKQQYALSYNALNGEASWVSWRLASDWLGPEGRSDNFARDPALPPNWTAIESAVYLGTGFDRGHVCPSADRTRSAADNAATFLMTNIIPQAPNLNRQPWRELESYCRGQAAQGRELFIVAGPAGRGGIGSEGRKARIGEPPESVLVPAACWKIVLSIPNKDGNDLDRIGPDAETIAVWMPNNQGTADAWKTYQTTIRSIELRTGIDFGSLLPREVQDVLELREP